MCFYYHNLFYYHSDTIIVFCQFKSVIGFHFSYVLVFYYILI